MASERSLFSLAALLLAASLVVTGCGGSSGDSGGDASPGSPSPDPAGGGEPGGGAGGLERGAGRGGESGEAGAVGAMRVGVAVGVGGGVAVDVAGGFSDPVGGGGLGSGDVGDGQGLGKPCRSPGVGVEVDDASVVVGEAMPAARTTDDVESDVSEHVRLDKELHGAACGHHADLTAEVTGHSAPAWCRGGCHAR